MFNKLDLNENNKLRTLICSDNNLQELLINNNLILEELNCNVNKITGLDLKQNSILTNIYCNNNKIIKLEFPTSNNDILNIDCSFNDIKFLDLTNNILNSSEKLIFNDNKLQGNGDSIIKTYLTSEFKGELIAKPQKDSPSGDFFHLRDDISVQYFMNNYKDSIPENTSYFTTIAI